jgi:signal transduction histidine kinase
MHLMTLSQILHFKLDCDQLEFQATELKSKSFPAHLETFLKPFEIQLQSKKVKVECSFEFDGLFQNDTIQEELKHRICADFKIYDCILFQLLSNAIKHCP